MQNTLLSLNRAHSTAQHALTTANWECGMTGMDAWCLIARFSSYLHIWVSNATNAYLPIKLISQLSSSKTIIK